jgi:hypothetical protein
MHNGTLTNWSYKEDAKLFDVDSEWAIHMIAKHGVDAFKLFTGAYAMMWWDQSKKDKLFIARNKERPLHFRLSDDKKIMYIASEAGMLAWLTERNELKTQKEIYTFEVGKLYTFNVNLGEITWTKEDLPAVAGTVASPQTAAGKESSQQNSTTAKGSSVNETDDVGFEGERFLDGIKMAASRARSFLYADANKSNLPSSSELSKAVDKAVTSITSSAADDGAIPLSEAFDDEDVPFSEVSDSSSREAGFDWIAEDSWYTLVGTGNREVELAKQMNVFAEVHWLEGVDFDEDRKELLGEVKDYLPGKGHVVYPTIVRGLTGGEAYHYIENMKNGKCGDYIVITGMYDDKMMGRTLIGTPLSKEGMAYINRKVN